MFENLFNNSKRQFYFLIGLALLIWFACKNMDIIFMVFASIIFACALNPLVDKLNKKMNRTLAATIVLTGLILCFCVVFVPIFVLGAQQVSDFINNFPAYIDQLDNTPIGAQIVNTFNFSADSAEEIMAGFADSTGIIFEKLSTFITGIGSAFLYIFTSLIILFFLLTDKKQVDNCCYRLLPKEVREKTADLAKNIFEKLGGYVNAQVLVSGSVWITMTIGLLLFKINYALVLGLIAGLLSLIPIVGSAISLVICLIATYESGFHAMLIVAILFTISHFLENHVVRPYIYSKFLDLHPIIIFLALFIGGKYAGVVGVLFGPPMAMALCILIDELYTKRMGI